MEKMEKHTKKKFIFNQPIFLKKETKTDYLPHSFFPSSQILLAHLRSGRHQLVSERLPICALIPVTRLVLRLEYKGTGAPLNQSGWFYIHVCFGLDLPRQLLCFFRQRETPAEGFSWCLRCSKAWNLPMV